VSFDRRSAGRGGAHAGGRSPAMGSPGKRTLTEQLTPVEAAHAPAVQRRAGGATGDAAGARDEAAVHASAARGIATSGSALPYAEMIQRSFGRHDISSIQAHTGAEASSSAREMGADAYAAGNHVVLGRGTDLFTVAHEAAHVIQQRGGVQLKGGVGEAGDRYEQHADAVAALVVQGKSSEALLDVHAGAPVTGAGGDVAASAVQRKPTRWGDIAVNGVGAVWAPHRTQIDGHGRSTSSGAALDAAPAPVITYTGVGLAGGLGVRVANLGRNHPVSAPIASDAVFHLKQAAKQPLVGYQNVALLPANLGGVDGYQNVVALPPGAAGWLQNLHGVATQLVEGAGTHLSYSVDVTEAVDPGPGISFAQALRARWAQVRPNGAEVAGSVGDYTITAPPPSQYAGGDTSAARATDLGPGVANQAQAQGPLPRMPGARAAELKTSITFGPVNGVQDGTRMTAHVLGPDHKIGDQPGSGQVWSKRTQDLHNASSKKMKYVAGHLLNHHLGGPGDDARNLAPIPSDVNDLHESQVESVIKNLVNRQGRWVYYDVQVSHAIDNGVIYPSAFTCTWAQLDPAGQIIAGTVAQKTFPIKPPSVYAGTPPPPGKKLPNLATTTVNRADPNAHAPAAGGARTTLGFDEVLLEDSDTLKHQLHVMKPLVASLQELGLNAQFQHNGALQRDVFNGLAAVKPSPAEAAARDEVERLTQELRALTVNGGSDGARDLINALRQELDVFEAEVQGRTLRTDQAAGALLGEQYSQTRAGEFAQRLHDTGQRALRDLMLTKQSATVVIGFAEHLLNEQDHYVASLHTMAVPPSPNQAMMMDDEESTLNLEQDGPSKSGNEALRRMAGRRAQGTGGWFAQPPQQTHGADALLQTIQTLTQGHRKWPMSEGSGLGPDAVLIGKAIEAMVPGSPTPTSALEMVVRSLYQTNTRAFNEYAAWLAQRLADPPSPNGSGVGDDGLLAFFTDPNNDFDDFFNNLT
jgi:Domain of unknown function (DUF4157)/DNA/RNA non-specific endonuclease